MFNDDQRDYMRSLAKTPHEEKCWCGWYRLGQCYGGGHCNDKHPGKSRADYLAEACPECFTLPPTHTIGCSRAEDTP